MNAKEYQRLRELFVSCCDLDHSERAAWLDTACPDDERDLREELGRLLEEDSDDDGLQPVTAPAGERQALFGRLVAHPCPSRVSTLPDAVGRYRIVGLIAEGGMGVVYRAEQDAPRRTVALKVVRAGLASPHTIRRFEYEAQVLGLLKHPGIAQIYEAGTVEMDHGVLPFFAMELVEGETIVDYAERRHLGVRERLALLARVCDAVHHAHQKGVIHRDLKPSNILVAEEGEERSAPSEPYSNLGQPKVLDFGVARATDLDLRTTTLRTDLGQLVGTIPYMSPEQAGGNPDEIDTRSDVYALGVIAYQLLSGRLPYDLAEKPLFEAVRVIRDEEPSLLSSISRAFRGDVEIIVARALEKEKERRYQSAQELASDIRRHLSDEPIDARPPSASYQLSKFARRNKPLLAGLLACVLILLLGIGGTSSGMIAARKGQALAEERDQESEAVITFLSDMLAAAHPSLTGKDVLVRDVLDRAAERIGQEMAGRPLVEARLRETIASTYSGLGDDETAADQAAVALSIYRQQLGPDSLRTLHAMSTLGVLSVRLGRNEAAEELLTDALRNLKRQVPTSAEETVVVMYQLGGLYRNLARHEDALDVLTGAVRIGERELTLTHSATRSAINELALLETELGRFDEAEALYLRTLTAPGVPDALNQRITLSNLALLYVTQARAAEAETIYLDLIKECQEQLGIDHIASLTAMNNLAMLYCNQEQYEQAGAMWEEVYELIRVRLGEDHPHTLTTMSNLGSAYLGENRLEDARQLFEQVLPLRLRILGPDHPDTAISMAYLGTVDMRQGRLAEAEPLLAEAVAIARRAFPQGHWQIGRNLTKYADLLIAQERFTDAEAALTEALETLTASIGREHFRTQDAVRSFVTLYERWERPERADAYRAMLEDG